MTINQYLQSVIVGVALTDNQIEIAILNVDGLATGADMSTVSERQKDLATAEVFWLGSRMVGGGSYSKKVNNRQISETSGSLSREERMMMIDDANALRAKWGLPAFRENSQVYDVTHLWK
jgi:hypothetical protein